MDVASANGYVVGSNASIAYPPPPEDYQFTVSVTSPVETFFLRIFGQTTVTMSRQATAEYVLPLPMGSPEDELGGASREFWMAIQAPKTRREYGDPYATQCLLNDGYDQTACDPAGSSNPSYRSSGYYIGVEIPTGASGLDIWLYDAGFYEASIFDDTGDYGWNLGYGARTTFRVYEPDGTPLDHSDNPLATCNLGYGPVETLEPEDNSPNTEGWTRLCQINSTVPGRYLVQVSTDNIGHAMNHYAIRADSLSGPPPQVFGIQDMSIFANFSGSSATFYLAEVEDVHAGKDLELSFFDPGDVNSGSAFITVLDPYGGIAANCSWQAISWVDGSIEETGSTCVIDATRPAHDFNGDWVQVTVDLPASYTCNLAGLYGGCWWQVRLDYSSEPFDRTTWEARIVGNPIHLVND